MNINLHIERLVIDGSLVADGQGPFVQAAVADELARLLSSNGLAVASAGNEVSLNAGEIHCQPKTFAGQLGQKIGRSVFASLNSSGRMATPVRKGCRTANAPAD
jgi:hypothetical protein